MESKGGLPRGFKELQQLLVVTEGLRLCFFDTGDSRSNIRKNLRKVASTCSMLLSGDISEHVIVRRH